LAILTGDFAIFFLSVQVNAGKVSQLGSEPFILNHLKFLFPVALRSNAGDGLLILDVYRSYTTTHHNR